MRSLLFGALALIGSAACQTQGAVETTVTEAEIASALMPVWRDVSPENLILIETRYGDIVVELNTDFAPNHANQFRQLVRDDVYNGIRFYRVIDAFVAQGGLQDDEAIEPFPTLENENDRPISDAKLVPLGNADLFAPIVGHIDGFAAGRSQSLEREWLLHCPGALAMARDTDPDSGSTEFYIVLDAQRYLDRNLTIFGRVIDGMQYVQKLKRGDRAVGNGVIQAPEVGDEILSMTVAADMAEAIRPKYQVQAMPSQAFEDAKTAKRVRDEDFFYRKPPEVLDICGFEVPVRRTPEPETSPSSE
ncbi:MAG: peptidylprolyl isomerase [Pseudomonadota bacterium]